MFLHGDVSLRERALAETLFWRIDGMWAVRHGDLKLAHGEVNDDPPELFDLARDPGDAAAHDHLGIATLDTPAVLRPTEQYWAGERMPWFSELAGLPPAGAGDDLPDDERRRRKSYQHPDHDTAEWPPRH